MQPVGVRIDADPRQAQHRRGDLGDRRVAHGLRKRRIGPRRIHRERRQLRVVQDVQNFLGRLLIGQLIRQDRE